MRYLLISIAALISSCASTGTPSLDKCDYNGRVYFSASGCGSDGPVSDFISTDETGLGGGYYLIVDTCLDRLTVYAVEDVYDVDLSSDLFDFKLISGSEYESLVINRPECVTQIRSDLYI